MIYICIPVCFLHALLPNHKQLGAFRRAGCTHVSLTVSALVAHYVIPTGQEAADQVFKLQVFKENKKVARDAKAAKARGPKK